MHTYVLFCRNQIIETTSKNKNLKNKKGNKLLDSTHVLISLTKEKPAQK